MDRNTMMDGPHVHVPFDSIDKYLPFLREHRLNLELYFGSRTFDDLDERDMVTLKNKLDYLPDTSIHGPFMDLSPGGVDPKIRELTVKRFSDTLDFAAILKSKAVVFHSGYDRWKYDNRMDIWLEASLKTWSPLVKKAADIGVNIAIENIFEDEPTHLALLAKEIDSKHFGICFDTGHFNLFSKMTVSEWLGMIKPYIKELHLHDNERYKDQHLPIGEGDFDFETLFRETADIDCVRTIEAHSERDLLISLERYRQYIPRGRDV